MATYVFQSSMDLKVRVVHKTYREHYMLFQGYIPNSLSELVVETRKLMVRSDSPILDQFDESYTAGGWTGRISWIDKEGDEILLVDDANFHCYKRSMKPREMGTIIIRLASTMPEPDETMQLKPIEYAFDTAAPAASSVAPGIVLADQKKLPLHKNVLCDVCDSEIRGHRYKCMTCQNYDLCMSCEGKYRHKEHIMLRLPTPDIRCHGAYSVFDKLRQFVTKMTPLVTGEETSTGSTTAAEGRAANAGHSSPKTSHPGTGCNVPKNNGCRKQYVSRKCHKKGYVIPIQCDYKTEAANEATETPATAQPSESSVENRTPFVDLIEALTSVAKQELKSKHDTANGNGSGNAAEEKGNVEKDVAVEEQDSTDELWTVLDGLGSTIPEEVLVQLDSPGPSSVPSPVKNTEPTTPPKETDATASPPNRTQPDVKSKINQLTELVAAAVLEGTRLMSVPSPEQPVPPPTIQDDHDEDAAPVDDPAASAKTSGASSATATGTSSSGPSSADPNKVYSELPHVNHAIHTLITMGFSNDNGWLTRLLESLDGDIPKALDLLLLQPSATNSSSRSS
ncbi:sequestosome-1-like [Anopheles albimanus]|uniref:Uncharacterized protein n=1 Tax=Anopheles albimanus TaxID=7167 RepID=A0A182F4Z3_ANOAL|nr:sequestosome-1-like [Anopheles albimanus]